MKYIEKLRNSGLRPTKQRLQICEVLFDNEKTFHFSINDLANKIKKQINNSSSDFPLSKNMSMIRLKSKGEKKLAKSGI